MISDVISKYAVGSSKSHCAVKAVIILRKVMRNFPVVYDILKI